MMSLPDPSPADPQTSARASHDAEDRGSPRLALALSLLASCGALACIAVYAHQLYLGRWQNDEFHIFAVERRWGWHALLPRLSYSPRPFSELLLFAYGKAVLATHRPLIATFLGLLWLATLTVNILVAAFSLPRRTGRIVSAVLLVSAFFAFVLASGEVTEFFFWPAAAAAYMPTAGGALALVFLLSRPASATIHAAAGAILLVVATSSEVGAALTLGFAGAAATDALVRRLRGGGAERLAVHAWWAVPAMAGLAVLVTILLTRAGMDELGAASQPSVGHPLLALRDAIVALAHDVVFFNETRGVLPSGAAIPEKLCFAAAFVIVWRCAGGGASTATLATLFVAFGTAVFFSLFAAFLHYGTSCCERQATTRQWLIELMLVIAFAALVARLPGLTRRLATAPVRALAPLLLFACLWPILAWVPAFEQDSDAHGLALEARSRTWRSGERADTKTMKFYLPPEGSGILVRGTWEPLATYGDLKTAPPLITAVGAFFDKSTVIVCQPWQTDKSLMLHGRLVQACPPHGGLPDIVDDDSRRMGYRAATDPR